MLVKSRTEILFEALAAQIEKMQPGDRLMSVRQIMLKYGVSQLTIDQAMKKLETRGKIIREPYRGIFVSNSNETPALRLGLIVPDWISQNLNELEEMLKLGGKAADCVVTRYNYPPGSQIHNELPVKEFDVIALIPDFNMMTPEFIYKVGTASVPVILCWVLIPDVQICCVSGDPVATGEEAASYLIAKGHRDLAVMISSPLSSSVIRSRIAGFRRFALANGCRVTEIDAEIQPSDFAQEKVYKVLSRWLKEHPLDITAMYVLNDESALAAVRAFSDHGIAVPEQVSVVGADGSRNGIFYHPPLTTVGVEAEKVAAGIIKIAKALAIDRTQVLQDYILPTIIERSSVRDLTQKV